jgi:hypothetical protein
MALDAGGDVDMGASDAKQTEGGDGPGTAADTADEEDADATDDATADEEDGDAETTDADDDEDDAADATIDEELAEAILAGEVDMADANDDGDDTDSDASSHGPASKRNNGPSSSMEYHYPAPIDNYADVPTREKQFRAGRFLPCQVAGCTCTGMEPPHGAIIHISVGEPMDPAVVKASKNMTAEGWWRTCGICGHGWEGTGHVFPDRVDGSERERRGRVMSRIEEMLAVSKPSSVLINIRAWRYIARRLKLKYRKKSCSRISLRLNCRPANRYTSSYSHSSGKQVANGLQHLFLPLSISPRQGRASWTWTTT